MVQQADNAIQFTLGGIDFILLDNDEIWYLSSDFGTNSICYVKAGENLVFIHPVVKCAIVCNRNKDGSIETIYSKEHESEMVELANSRAYLESDESKWCSAFINLMFNSKE